MEFGGKSKNKAFTLAEVLITLGIIGIVAAMTLPTLLASIEDQRNITMLKKFYSDFYNATNLLVNDYGEPGLWGLNGDSAELSEELIHMYTEQLNVIKICNQTDPTCFQLPIYNYDGTSAAISEPQRAAWILRSFVLSNGVTGFFDINVNNFAVYFDVNGFKKPNTLGKDVFALFVNSKGKIVSYNDETITNGNDNEGYNYAYRIMSNGWRKDY